MIERIELKVSGESKTVVIIWSETQEDYVFIQVPNHIPRYEMIQILDEVKRITEWDK